MKIPLGVMTCVTGVSGSGKSSLVKGILYPAVRRKLFETGVKPGSFEGLAGDVGMLKSIEMIDQNPIGKSQRSNPVTYTKAYDYIRKIFADQPYAVNNGMTPSYFSFNRPGGRCEECQGDGFVVVGMQFRPTSSSNVSTAEANASMTTYWRSSIMAGRYTMCWR